MNYEEIFATEIKLAEKVVVEPETDSDSEVNDDEAPKPSATEDIARLGPKDFSDGTSTMKDAQDMAELLKVPNMPLDTAANPNPGSDVDTDSKQRWAPRGADVIVTVPPKTARSVTINPEGTVTEIAIPPTGEAQSYLDSFTDADIAEIAQEVANRPVTPSPDTSATSRGIDPTALEVSQPEVVPNKVGPPADATPNTRQSQVPPKTAVGSFRFGQGASIDTQAQEAIDQAAKAAARRGLQALQLGDPKPTLTFTGRGPDTKIAGPQTNNASMMMLQRVEAYLAGAQQNIPPTQRFGVAAVFNFALDLDPTGANGQVDIAVTDNALPNPSVQVAPNGTIPPPDQRRIDRFGTSVAMKALHASQNGLPKQQIAITGNASGATAQFQVAAKQLVTRIETHLLAAQQNVPADSRLHAKDLTDIKINNQSHLPPGAVTFELVEPAVAPATTAGTTVQVTVGETQLSTDQIESLKSTASKFARNALLDDRAGRPKPVVEFVGANADQVNAINLELLTQIDTALDAMQSNRPEAYRKTAGALFELPFSWQETDATDQVDVNLKQFPAKPMPVATNISVRAQAVLDNTKPEVELTLLPGKPALSPGNTALLDDLAAKLIETAAQRGDAYLPPVVTISFDPSVQNEALQATQHLNNALGDQWPQNALPVTVPTVQPVLLVNGRGGARIDVDYDLRRPGDHTPPVDRGRPESTVVELRRPTASPVDDGPLPSETWDGPKYGPIPASDPSPEELVGNELRDDWFKKPKESTYDKVMANQALRHAPDDPSMPGYVETPWFEPVDVDSLLDELGDDLPAAEVTSERAQLNNTTQIAPRPGQPPAFLSVRATSGPIAFSHTVLKTGSGQVVDVLTVKQFMPKPKDVDEADYEQVKIKAKAAVNTFFNKGNRLPNGHQLHVRLQFVATCGATEHPPITLHPKGSGLRENSSNITLDSTDVTLAHELAGHPIGLFDEYVEPDTNGAVFLRNPPLVTETNDGGKLAGQGRAVFDNGMMAVGMHTTGARFTPRNAWQLNNMLIALSNNPPVVDLSAQPNATSVDSSVSQVPRGPVAEEIANRGQQDSNQQTSTLSNAMDAVDLSKVRRDPVKVDLGDSDLRVTSVEHTLQRLNRLRQDKPYTFMTGEYDPEIADLEVRLGKLLVRHGSVLQSQIDLERGNLPTNPVLDLEGFALSQHRLTELKTTRKAVDVASVLSQTRDALKGYKDVKNALGAEQKRLQERKEAILSSPRGGGRFPGLNTGLRQGRQIIRALNKVQITQLAYYAAIRELNELAQNNDVVSDEAAREELEARVSELHAQIEHLSDLDELPPDALNLFAELGPDQINQLFYEYELPVIDQALRDVTEKLDLVAADEVEMLKQMSGQQVSTSNPVEYTRGGEGRLDQLVSQLPTMSPMQRSAALERLHGNRQNILAGKPEMVRRLRDTLPPEVFAQTAAQLMVRWPGDVDHPVTARHETENQVARMLSNPDVTKRLLNKGVQVVIIPENTPLTALKEFQHLAGSEISPSHGGWDTARGAGGTILVTVGAENLTGGNAPVGRAPHYDDGYSVLMHEFAQTIYKHGLTEEDRRTITQAFAHKRDEANTGEQVRWPGWPTYGPYAGISSKSSNDSATTPEEYFAQLTAAYHGANTGHDPYTRQPRNNGEHYIEQHEPPEIVTIMRRVYGRYPIPTNSTTASATNSPKLNPTRLDTSNAARLKSPNHTPHTNNHTKTNPTHTNPAIPMIAIAPAAARLSTTR